MTDNQRTAIDDDIGRAEWDGSIRFDSTNPKAERKERGEINANVRPTEACATLSLGEN